MAIDLATRAEPMLPEPDAATKLEQVVIEGNLAALTPIQRVAYYRAVCESVGLNPLTKPFEYISLNGKLTLYATRGATDQLRSIRRIEVHKLERERADDLAIVTAYGRDHTGRQDSAIGAVNILNLKGEALANALMKAETKAKRRLTLSLAGLGLLDEIEAESIPGGWKEDIDPVTGELTAGENQQDLEARLAAQAAQAEAELAEAEKVTQTAEAPTETPEPATEAAEAVSVAQDVFEGEIVPEGASPLEQAIAAMPTQCESKSPFGEGDDAQQCRREVGHPGPHKTRTESWPR